MSYSSSRREEGIQLSIRDKTYVDLSLAFVPSPLNGDITKLTNERAINNSLKNIVMTLVSETPFFRDFGSRTSAYLFDIIDEANAILLGDEIERAILFSEPRVAFVRERTTSDLSYDKTRAEGIYSNQSFNPQSFGAELGVKVIARPEQNEYSVTVTYLIVGTERVFNVEMLLTPTR